MDETGSAFGTEDLESQEKQNSAPDSGRRLLRRPTTAETERIARDCPPDGLSVPVIVGAIRRETGCSRATAYRAVADAFADGTLARRRVPVPVLVAALRRETRCSRATAYRSLADALASGKIQRANAS